MSRKVPIPNAVRGIWSNVGYDRRSSFLNLCFHGIGTPGRALEPDEDQYWIDVPRFDALLDVIQGYPRTRITFDDGNASDTAIALPALLERNLAGTFFVVAGRIGRPGSLSASQIRELVECGMTVGLHGMLHRPWRNLDDADLHVELVDAARIIADIAGQPIREAACPFGAYDRTVLRAIRESGFTRVYTVDGGSANDSAWLQPRYTVRCDDTPTMIEKLAQSPQGTSWESAVRGGKTFIKRLR